MRTRSCTALPVRGVSREQHKLTPPSISNPHASAYQSSQLVGVNQPPALGKGAGSLPAKRTQPCTPPRGCLRGLCFWDQGEGWQGGFTPTAPPGGPGTPTSQSQQEHGAPRASRPATGRTRIQTPPRPRPRLCFLVFTWKLPAGKERWEAYLEFQSLGVLVASPGVLGLEGDERGQRSDSCHGSIH